MKAKLKMSRKTLVSALMVLFIVSIIPVLADNEARVSLMVTVLGPELPAEITGVETRDSTGVVPKTEFVSGENVYVYADVTNRGTVDQPMIIVVQLKDPDNCTISPNCGIYTLIPGQTFGNAPSFLLDLTGYTAGTWTVKVMILDTWPALNGVPIGTSVTINFTVN